MPFPFMPGTHALLKMTRPAGKPWAPPTGRTRQASVGRPCVPRRGQATLPRRPGCRAGREDPRRRRVPGEAAGRGGAARRKPHECLGIGLRDQHFRDVRFRDVRVSSRAVLFLS